MSPRRAFSVLGAAAVLAAACSSSATPQFPAERRAATAQPLVYQCFTTAHAADTNQHSAQLAKCPNVSDTQLYWAATAVTATTPTTQPVPTTATTQPATTTTQPAGVTATITDAQCTPAETTCPMTFAEDATKDLDPYSGALFGQPKPGLLAGWSDANLTPLTAMPSCVGAGPFHNCRPAGYTSGTLLLDKPANVNQAYYFDNCIIANPIQIGRSYDVPGLRVYVTNCHVKIGGDNDGPGTIGNGAGGGLYLLHDFLDGSGAPAVTHPMTFAFADPGVVSHVFYSYFYENTDQARVMAPVDFEWNYIHNDRCDKATTPACAHTDGGLEVYGGGSPAPDASHRITIANNYFSALADSTGGPANITTDFGPNGYIWVQGNKALPTFGSGYNAQGIIVQQNAGGATLSNVHLVGNTFFASATRPPSILGFGGSICAQRPFPNACIAEDAGNTQVSASGVVSTWSGQ